MKKIKTLTHLIFLIIYSLMNEKGFSQTTLSAGDIAITGFTSDDPDQFSFVLLTDVAANTIIKFTDNGWLQSGGFRNNEGTITWVANTDLYCGTEITIAFAGSNTYTSTKGNATETNLGFALATLLGDQILAYQGTDDSPIFIYAINFSNTGWSNATTANDSAIPNGLTNGVNAISLVQTDNAIYNCNVTSNTPAILNSVSTLTNWTLNTNRISIGGCYYSCEACTGGTVRWNGSWNGNPDITTQVIISSDYNTENGGNQTSFSACSLKIESGTTLNIANNTSISVENDLTIEAGGEINVQHSGAFIQNNNLSKINNEGIITVNKTTAHAQNWYEFTYWSSPVVNADISNGLTDSQSGRQFLFYAQNYLDKTKEVGNNNNTVNGQDDIDDNGNDWQGVSGNTIMQPGVGYATNHNRSIFETSGLNQFNYSFEGTFNNGIISVPIYRNDSELNDNNWNFIGNPYPCAIDADKFLDENTIFTNGQSNGNLNGAIYLWSQNTPPSELANGNQAYNFSDADYAIINKTGEIAGGDGVKPTRFIPSCQGFFVSMANNAPATIAGGDIYTTNVTFNNGMRAKGTLDNNQFFKNASSATTINKLLLNLMYKNEILDQTLIGYINGATNANDGLYFDAAIHSSNITPPILYSIIEGSDKRFGIQGKSVDSINENEVIKLGFSTPFEQLINYKISIAQVQGDFLNNAVIYLKDNLLNTTHLLSDSDYTFSSQNGEFKSRFEIVFQNKTLENNLDYLEEKSIQIIDIDSQNVQFKSPDLLSIKSISIYDLLGKQLYRFKGNSKAEIYNVSLINNMIYFAKIELSNGQIITKKAFKK